MTFLPCSNEQVECKAKTAVNRRQIYPIIEFPSQHRHGQRKCLDYFHCRVTHGDRIFQPRILSSFSVIAKKTYQNYH